MPVSGLLPLLADIIDGGNMLVKLIDQLTHSRVSSNLYGKRYLPPFLGV